MSLEPAKALALQLRIFIHKFLWKVHVTGFNLLPTFSEQRLLNSGVLCVS